MGWEQIIQEDLVTTMQKRPFLKMLREWREDSESSVEVDLLNDVIKAVQSGEFDG